MGYEYGDAQNIAVRVFLNQISKKFKYFDTYYYRKTLEYFDYKCPYTGESISVDSCERDHVIPFNKKRCGLHVYGNVLLVTRAANSKKGSKSLEEFLKNEPERLAKIKKFVEESGYNQIHEKYNEELKRRCTELYKNIGSIVRNCYESFDENNTDEPNETIKKHIVIKETPNIKSNYSDKRIVKQERNITNYNAPSLSKQDIVRICRQNGLNMTNWHTKAAKNYTQNKYWANPNIKNLHHDWWLTLDDYNNRILYCFKIPANSINENQVKVRNDQQHLIDLQIYYDTRFVDSRSGISFAKWLVKDIKY